MNQAVKLGDVADVVAGVGFPKDMQGRAAGEIPVFKVGDISAAWTAGERVLRASRNYLTADEALKLGRPVPSGSTVFAKIGEALRLNRRAVLGQSSLVDNNVMALVPTVGALAPMYLFYFMQTVDLGKLARATAVPSIRKSDVVEIPIPLPSLHEQAGVVAELEKQFSRLDEAVTNLRRVKANLKRYKAAVLKAAVEGRLVPIEAELARREGHGYESGARLLQRVMPARQHAGRRPWQIGNEARSDVSTLPEGWSLALLGELAETASGGTPRRDSPANYGGHVPWVKSGELRDGVIVSTEESITAEGLENSSSKIFPKGTLCIALYGATVGRLGVLGIDAATNQAVCGIFPEKAVTTAYLRVFLGASRRLLVRLAQGGAQPNISQTILRKLSLPVPPLAEQHRIVAAVDSCESLILEVEAEIEVNLKRAQALRASTLATFFGCAGTVS